MRVGSLVFAGAVALLAAAWLSPRVVPYNMDEFVHYQALGCASAPLQRGVPAYRDGCFLYDLRLPGTSEPLPLRSYYYIGSFPSLPFYPFWRLLRDPVAVRVQGAVFFVAWVLLAARLLRVRCSVVLVAALALPVFLTTFLVDLGPVGLAAILFTASLLAARRALAAQRGANAAAWAALAGLLLFLGVWSKLVFVCLLPAVVVHLLFEMRTRGGWKVVWHRCWPALAAGALALLLPTLVLLASVDVEGRPYAAALGRGRVSLAPRAVAGRLTELTRAMLDPREAASRNVLLPRSTLDVVPALLAGAVLLGAVGRRQARRREIVGWAVLAGVTLGGLALSEYCRWPHHAFYALLLLVPALALALDGCGRRARVAVAAAVVVLCWSSLAVRWPHASFPGESSPEKDELLRFVRARGLDRETLQVHSSWGTYYIAQLFGDPLRTVVYLKGISDDPVQMREVRQLALERGRPLLLIGSRRWDRLQTPGVDRVFGRPEHTWRFGDWWALQYPRQSDEAPAASTGREPLRSASPRP